MQDLTKLSDRELVVAYANDSNEAFDILLERHKNRVYTYILHIVKNKDLADDIFQETFVKAIMTIRQGTLCRARQVFRLAHTHSPQPYHRLFPSGESGKHFFDRRRRV